MKVEACEFCIEIRLKERSCRRDIYQPILDNA